MDESDTNPNPLEVEDDSGSDHSIEETMEMRSQSQC